MVQITCPHCGQVFEEDESKFQSILNQVYRHQLEEALDQRDKSADAVLRSSVAAAEAAVREEMGLELTERDRRIAELSASLGAADETAKAQAQKSVAEATNAVREELSQELASRDQRIAELSAQLSAASQTAQAQMESALLKEQGASAATIAKLEARVAELEGDAAELERRAAVERELAVTTAEAKLREEATAREAKLREESAARENELAKTLEERDDELARMRDMRSRMSTKMLGESLEQHCENSFNQLRATAFKTAQFGKDTQAVSAGADDRATKGDYIFRDFDESGEEFISIMFEMKTDDERTSRGQRRKNEDFFHKLDADRRKKGCEYAVLVSLLEPESELYNQGIVDVSWAYEKMYVIRPQLFVPMITLLRDAAKTQLSARQELAEVRRQNIDVTNFEAAMEDFKAGFTKNYESASTHFGKVIDEIDKAIANLERTKKELYTTANQLRLANNKVDNLTIRRLTSKNPTMREKFEEARREAAPLVEPAAEGEEGTEPDSVE